MDKDRIVRLFGRALRSRLLRPFLHSFLRHNFAIVFYHGVWQQGSPLSPKFYGSTTDRLYADLKVLSDHCRFIRLGDVLEALHVNRPLVEPSVAICFDDGYNLPQSGVCGILQEFSAQATCFVITACMNNAHLMWMHKAAAICSLRGTHSFLRAHNQFSERSGLGVPVTAMANLLVSVRQWPMRRKDEIMDEIYSRCDMPPAAELLEQHQPYMTWSDLQAWVSQGHEIGLHTRTHPFCSRLEDADLEDEIFVPARQLMSALGTDRLPFAYPFGDRLGSEALERAVFKQARLSCMLGVNGINAPGTRPWRLERADGERTLDWCLFGKPPLQAVLGSLKRVPRSAWRYHFGRGIF